MHSAGGAAATARNKNNDSRQTTPSNANQRQPTPTNTNQPTPPKNRSGKTEMELQGELWPFMEKTMKGARVGDTVNHKFSC